MRHGTETENLCWKHTNVIEQDGAKYLTFNVDGKTGRRELLAKPNYLVYLIRIRQRFYPELTGTDMTNFSTKKL
jgi:integrase